MKLDNISSTTSLKEYLTKNKNVILMIHKHNCPYCEKAKPWLEEFNTNPETKIAEAEKENIREVLDAFQVKMYPTFVSIENGIITDIFFGDTQYDKVKDFVVRNSN